MKTIKIFIVIVLTSFFATSQNIAQLTKDYFTKSSDTLREVKIKYDKSKDELSKTFVNLSKTKKAETLQAIEILIVEQVILEHQLLEVNLPRAVKETLNKSLLSTEANLEEFRSNYNDDIIMKMSDLNEKSAQFYKVLITINNYKQKFMTLGVSEANINNACTSCTLPILFKNVEETIKKQIKVPTKEENKDLKGIIEKFNLSKTEFDEKKNSLTKTTKDFDDEKKNSRDELLKTYIEYSILNAHIEQIKNESNVESEKLIQLREKALVFAKDINMQKKEFEANINESIYNTAEKGYMMLKKYKELNATISLHKARGMSQADINDLCDNDACKLPIDNVFSDLNPEKITNIDNVKEIVFLLFDNDQLMDKEDIIKDPIANQILTNVLQAESRLHLGNFWIPKDEQEIPVLPNIYIEKKNKERKYKRQYEKHLKNNKEKKANRKKTEIENIEKDKIIKNGFKWLKFERVDLEIFEGSLIDIKVILKQNEHTYIFENTGPVSLLKYLGQSENVYLENVAQQSFDNIDNDFADFSIKLSDVLRYVSRPGRNYIPDDQSFSFPIRTRNSKENKDTPVVYELHQDTSLQNVVDFRTYTDFLGLFGDNPNGLTQIEGSGSFFVNPFSKNGKNLFFFKKIKPYISYSRLDDNSRNLAIDTLALTMNDTIQRVELRNRLDNIQQSFLDLGVELDIISHRFSKEFPFEYSLYGSLRYNIASIDLPNIDTNTYTTLGTGLGLNLTFRRYENFQFNASTELTYYKQNSFNDIILNGNFKFEDSPEFWVHRTQAEVSYFPANSRSNSIFLRVRVYNDLGSNGDANFFQLQFGYKFTLGVQRLQTNERKMK